MVLAQPVFNYLGNSYSASFESGVITMTVFSMMYLLKGAVSSGKSTRLWLEFNRLIRAEMALTLLESTEAHLRRTFPREYRPAQVPKWIEREVRMRRALIDYFQPWRDRCDRILSNLPWRNNS